MTRQDPKIATRGVRILVGMAGFRRIQTTLGAAPSCRFVLAHRFALGLVRDALVAKRW
jgi:hypothetical protein